MAVFDLAKGWFCEHSVGRGAISLAAVGGSNILSAGTFYFEVLVTTAGSEYKGCIGIANSSFDLTNPVALDIAAGNYSGLNGGCFISFRGSAGTTNGWSGDPGPSPNAFGTAFTLGDTIGIAGNTSTGRVWWRNATAAPTVWVGLTSGGTPNPVTGIEGYPFVTNAAVAGFVYILLGAGNDSTAGANYALMTLNTGFTAFVAAAPTGFSAWDSTSLTVLNSSDKAAEITLSGGNRTMTSTAIAGANQPTAFVRSNTRKAT